MQKKTENPLFILEIPDLPYYDKYGYAITDDLYGCATDSFDFGEDFGGIIWRLYNFLSKTF